MSRAALSLCCFAVLTFLCGCGSSAVNTSSSGGSGGSGGSTKPTTYQLTVQSSGAGGGTVTSSPAGINCGTTCTATFSAGTVVTLTETPAASSSFGGWGSGCSGTGSCSVTMNANTTVTASFAAVTASLESIDHDIILMQENRSLDHYFGALRQYWAQNGFPDQSFDGLPQFNPTTGAAPLLGPAPSIPGCNPADPAPSDCDFDTSNPVTSYHFLTMCNENPPNVERGSHRLGPQR